MDMQMLVTKKLIAIKSLKEKYFFKINVQKDNNKKDSTQSLKIFQKSSNAEFTFYDSCKCFS